MSKKKFSIDKDSLYQKIMPASTAQPTESPDGSAIAAAPAPEVQQAETPVIIIQQGAAAEKPVSLESSAAQAVQPIVIEQPLAANNQTTADIKDAPHNDIPAALQENDTDDTVATTIETDSTNSAAVTAEIDSPDKSAAAIETDTFDEAAIEADSINDAAAAAEINNTVESTAITETAIIDETAIPAIIDAAIAKAEEVLEEALPENTAAEAIAASVAQELQQVSEEKAPFPMPINMAEKVVVSRIRESLEANHCCTCQRCQLDAAAIALNHITPKYISRFSPSAALGDMFYNQHFAAILSAMLIACTQVGEAPRHDEPIAGELLLCNAMEPLVEEKITNMFLTGTDDYCRCDHCVSDLAALMLNGLTPRYTVTSAGLLYSKLIFMRHQFAIDLTTQYTKAEMIVKNNPRH